MCNNTYICKIERCIRELLFLRNDMSVLYAYSRSKYEILMRLCCSLHHFMYHHDFEEINLVRESDLSDSFVENSQEKIHQMVGQNYSLKF